MFAAVLSAAMLAGCGGGDDVEAVVPPVVVPPAVVIPASLSGLRVFAISNGRLTSFTPDAPTTSASDVALTGLTAGETIAGMDFRPQNGFLYALGVNAAADTATLYSVSISTGVLTAVGSAGSIALTTNGVTTVDLPDPAASAYGVNFNPAVDRLRVVAGALNFRVNPNTGTAVDGNNGGSVTAGTNPDGATNGAATSVDGAAYTNNQPNGSITTLYTLDSASNSLLIQSGPNLGTQTSAQLVKVNGATLDFSRVSGFDIPSGVNAATSNAAVASGPALAALTVSGVTSLYLLDLTTAAAQRIGTVGTGTVAVQSLAIRNQLSGLPAIALDGSGSGTLLRFITNAPATTTTQAVSGLAAGERLVGVDWRPATGQLYGLGVDATANTASVYLIDPQTGVAAVVGPAGQIAFADAGVVDLPDPAVAAYGFNFNPAADRIRVTTSTGLNFRVNPITGAPVDGDAIAAGVNTDGIINGSGATGVSGASYTNAVGGTTVTTLYTIDSVTRNLFIQNPPNGGTQTAPLPVTLGGSALAFSAINGFDITAGVTVATSNAAVTAGSAFAVLTVGGVTGLYQINLTTGAATNAGPVGAGATVIAGLALGNGP